jgi:hypothetical protein
MGWAKPQMKQYTHYLDTFIRNDNLTIERNKTMNKITINGIELELTDEQAAGLVEQYQKTQDDWPQAGDEYWCVDMVGDIRTTQYHEIYASDIWRKSIGNCFRTKEEAEHYRNYLVALNTLKKSSDFVPDWGDSDQRKYSIEHRNDEGFTIYDWIKTNDATPVYYRTSEEAAAALAKYHREFEIVYGVAK